MTLFELPRPRVSVVATLLVALTAAVATASPSVAAEDRYHVLVFHHAESFFHVSIPIAVRAFEDLGDEHGFSVTATDDPAVFTDEGLADVDVVAFVLTTGDAVPEPAQREAFERWHAAGGGWLGVHSAADTAFDWPYYGELLAGAYFLAHPIQQPGTAIVERDDHPATAHLGDTWMFPLEEYYSFTRNPREDTTVLVSMDESSYLQDPNTSNLPIDFSQGGFDPDVTEGVSGTMGDHPMVWCHDVADGRAFYTAFGHEGYLYLDPDFRQHLVGGLDAVAGAVDAPCHAARVSGPLATGTDPDAPRPTADEAGADAGPQGAAAPGTSAATDARPLPATGGAVGASGLLALLLATALRGPSATVRRRRG